jgi:hypothetical protein
MTDPTHGPIEGKQREIMNGIAEVLDEAFNMGERPKKIAFVLLTAHFGDYKGGRVNYISNGERGDIVTMMKELIARFEGRHSQETGHA